MTKRELSRKMAELGRAGAAARTKVLSAEQRHLIAQKAARARWSKKKNHEKTTKNN